MYGCKKIDISGIKRYRSLVIAGYKFILEVPKRTTGMTAFGKAHACHTNCQALLYEIGGKILRGYALQEEGDMIQFMFHSVWVSPEGKAVCVTRYGIDDPEFVRFIPLYETTLDGWKIDLPNLILTNVVSKLKKPKLSWYFIDSKCPEGKIESHGAPKSLMRKAVEKATSKLMGQSIAEMKHKITSRYVVKDTIENAGFYPPNHSLSWELMKSRIASKYHLEA